MRIDAVTTCVGEEYAGYLARSAQVWAATLSSLVVVTTSVRSMPDAILRTKFPGAGRVLLVESSAFTQGEASFNKGAALSEGMAHSIKKPSSVWKRLLSYVRTPQGGDWLLAFDCDILPPPNWLETIAPLLTPGHLYSAQRYKDGKPEDKRFYPRGYFQLWHVSDPHYRRSPIFDDHHKHAGRYDTAFAEQWPKDRWVELPIKLEHLGKKSANWFGPGTTREQMRGAQREARGVASP